MTVTVLVMNGWIKRISWSSAAGDTKCVARTPSWSFVQEAAIRATVPELEPHVASGMLAPGRYSYRYQSGREGETST